jgi:endogenous inhibitor of DNA gyrase (YacG/DUF329 family)
MSCPFCQKPADPVFAPFCSKLCKNTDLLRWFNEDYRIPTQEPVTEEDTDEVED